MTFQDIVVEYCQYIRVLKGYSSMTVTRYHKGLSLVIKMCQIKYLKELDVPMLERFFYAGRLERKWNAGTYLSYHSLLKTFFNWCINRGLVNKNPMHEVGVPKQPKRIPKNLSMKQALHIMHVARNYPHGTALLRARNVAIMATFIFTGIRRKELLNLSLEDLNLERGYIVVRQGKGSKDRIIPIGAKLSSILRNYLRARKSKHYTCPTFFVSLRRNLPLMQAGLDWLIKSIRQASGIKFHPHMFRHTFATMMIEGGCDIYSLSKLMGHTDITTTTIYLSASNEHLMQQIGKHPMETAYQFNA
jgi:site-specific recombinase XerD